MEYNLNNVIAERKTKTVYQDNSNTIKLFVENYSKANILNEALNQARVEEGTDLKIASLKEVTTINGRWAIVSEHITGKSLEELMKENPEKIDEYMNLFVDIQLEVLSKNVPLLNRMNEKYKSRITESDLFESNTKYELLQRLAGMDVHTKLCHGDFVPSNVIITENGEHYIIDWAHVTQGNAAGDCATTFLHFCLHNRKDLAEKYLEIFSQKSKIIKMVIQRWIPIVAANEYLKQKPEEKEMLKQWIDVVEYE